MRAACSALLRSRFLEIAAGASDSTAEKTETGEEPSKPTEMVPSGRNEEEEGGTAAAATTTLTPSCLRCWR